MAWSKEKKSEYNKRYYEENKDRIYVTRKKWSIKNKEKIDRQNKEYAKTHKEQIKANSKAWRERHKDEPEYKQRQKDAHKRYLSKPKNRDKWNAYCRQYRKRKALEGQI